MVDSVKALVLRYIEAVWNQGDLIALEEMTTPDYAYHLGGRPPRDRDGMRQFLEMTRSAFPDWRVEALNVVVERDAVAVRWEGRVTQLGTFHNIPATGKTIVVSGLNLYRVVDGKVAEEWEQTDTLGMLQQLGVLPQN